MTLYFFLILLWIALLARGIASCNDIITAAGVCLLVGIFHLLDATAAWKMELLSVCVEDVCSPLRCVIRCGFRSGYSLELSVLPRISLRTATSELQRRLLNAMPNRSSTHTIGITWYLPSLLSLCIVFSFRTQYLRNHPLKS